MIIWLVVYLPLWKIWNSVGKTIPNIWKNTIHVPNHQPVIHELFMIPWEIFAAKLAFNDQTLSHLESLQETGQKRRVFTLKHKLRCQQRGTGCQVPQQQSHHVPRFKTLIFKKKNLTLCPGFSVNITKVVGWQPVYRHSSIFKYIQVVLLSQNIGKYTEGSLRLLHVSSCSCGFQFLLTVWMFTSYFGVKKQRATVLTNTQLQRFVWEAINLVDITEFINQHKILWNLYSTQFWSLQHWHDYAFKVEQRETQNKHLRRLSGERHWNLLLWRPSQIRKHILYLFMGTIYIYIYIYIYIRYTYIYQFVCLW